MPEKPTDWRSAHTALFTVLLPISAFVPALQKWPLFWLAPLLAYAVIVAAFPRLRKTVTWLKSGKITRTGIAFSAAIIALASAALIAFQITLRPDLAAYRSAMPFEIFGTVAMTAILFPTINATLEELVYRGVLFDGIESQWNTRFAVVTTSLLFGIGHLQGYPPGIVGALLACIYGFAMGALRVHTKGLTLPIIAHIFADATIYGILVWHGAT
jgi:uncharacterized protein